MQYMMKYFQITFKSNGFCSVLVSTSNWQTQESHVQILIKASSSFPQSVVSAKMKKRENVSITMNMGILSLPVRHANQHTIKISC